MKKFLALLMAIVLGIIGSNIVLNHTTDDTAITAQESIDRSSEIARAEWANGYYARCVRATKHKTNRHHGVARYATFIIALPALIVLGAPASKKTPKMRKLEEYIVKSRTGRMYTFASLKAAEAFAKSKSTTKRFYTVYHGGKAVSAYANKKKLTEWTNVWSHKPNNENWSHIFDHTVWYTGETVRRDGKNKRVVFETIDKAPGKVRVTRSIQVLSCKKGKIYSRITKESVTYRANGTAMYYNGKTVKYTTDKTLWLEEDGNDILVECLKEIRPEIPFNAKPEYASITTMFTRPNVFVINDSGSIYNRTPANSPEEDFLLRKYMPKEYMTEQNVVKTITKKLAIPSSKTYKRLYAMSILNAFIVKAIMDIGFKDVNNVQKLSYLYPMLIRGGMREYKNLIHDFFTALISIKGENRVTQMLSTQDLSCLPDTIRTFYSIPEDITRYIIKESKNFVEIHDSFNAYIYTQRRIGRQLVNREIKYDQNEQRLNKAYGSVLFELARDSRDLAVTGAEMGICVGGYANAAASKQCTIVKMLDAGKHVGCIELRGNKMVQLKAKFNNPVKEEYREIINKWCEANKIDKECPDYNRIGLPWTSNYHYNHIDPAEYDRHDDNNTIRIIKSPTVLQQYQPAWQDDSAARITAKINEMVDQTADLHYPALVPFDPIETEELPF